MAAVSDEHGESIQQDITQSKSGKVKKWFTNIFGDCYCRQSGDPKWGIYEAKGGEVID